MKKLLESKIVVFGAIGLVLYFIFGGKHSTIEHLTELDSDDENLRNRDDETSNVTAGDVDKAVVDKMQAIKKNGGIPVRSDVVKGVVGDISREDPTLKLPQIKYTPGFPTGHRPGDPVLIDGFKPGKNRLEPTGFNPGIKDWHPQPDPSDVYSELPVYHPRPRKRGLKGILFGHREPEYSTMPVGPRPGLGLERLQLSTMSKML